jgi:hypothetical protein
MAIDSPGNREINPATPPGARRYIPKQKPLNADAEFIIGILA